MKRYFCPLLVILLFPLLPGYAKDRNWQDALVLGADSEQRGTYRALGATVPITMTWYSFQTDSTVYAVACRLGRRHPCPNVTIHGHAKVAVEGRNLRIHQDDGSDMKLQIVSKVARK
jgi:hypothetical protein